MQQRAGTRPGGALARFDGRVEVAATDRKRSVARQREALGQPRPEFGDGGEGLAGPVGVLRDAVDDFFYRIPAGLAGIDFVRITCTMTLSASPASLPGGSPI